MRRLLSFVLAALLFLSSPPVMAADLPVGELPDTATPLAYRIAIVADPARPVFSGDTEIDIDLKESTSSLFLHGQGLSMVRAEARTGRRTTRASYRQVHPTGLARLDFAEPLAAGRHTLVFRYSAPFMTSAEGFYRAEVAGRWYAWTQFQAIDARRAFPGFDEPRHKTPFAIRLTVPEGQMAVSNAPLVRTGRTRAGIAHDFAATEPLPTYLVAFAVGDFDVVEATIPANAVRSRPLAFRALATRGQAPRLATTVAETPKILAILEDYFGSPYPFAKLDVIASPIMGGAMENAGLVTFNDTLLLLDADAPLSQLRSFGVVMAHELAHMWFGDLVTPRWWDDIWLNESFATWMGNRAALQWRPDLGIRSDQIAGALAAMDEDSLAVGRPIRQPITDSANINAAFDGITYAKGGQVIRMFERYLGEADFQAGVRLHMDRFRYGTADANAFFQSMADGSGRPELVAAWKSFVDQEGVPLVRLAPAPGGRFALSQSRYAPIGGARAGSTRWTMPVCAASGEGAACALLGDKVGTLGPIVGTAPWVAGNADGAGYYRFDLDPAGWSRLLEAAPALPAPEALTAADSLWAGFAAGGVPFARVLEWAERFSSHPDRLAATWLAGPMAKAANEALGTGDNGLLERRIRAIYGPRLAAIGLDPARGAHAADPAEQRQLRLRLAQVLALDGMDPAVRARLAQAAEAALAGNASAIDPSFRGLAFGILVQEGGIPAADRLFEALVASNDPLFRQHAVAALGFTRDPKVATHVLTRFGDPRLQTTESVRLLSGLFGSPETRGLALDFLEGNWDTVRPRVGGLLGRFVGATGSFCTVEDADRVERIFRPRLAELNLGSLDLDRPVAEIRQCAALKAARGSDIRSALAAR
ncbi:M1 family metallopeptidase [Thermaurantiacus sp.]